MRRYPLMLLELAAAATAALSLLAGVAVFLLTKGPIPLDFLTPHIERALSPAGGPVNVRIGTTKLAWDGWQQPIDVRAEGVRIVNPLGLEMATLDEVSIGLSFPALMRGLVAPTSLDIRRPTMRLTRAQDGRFEFGLGDSVQGDEQPPLQRLIQGLLAPPNPEVASGYLERVNISEAVLTIEDQMFEASWKAFGANVELERSGGRFVAGFQVPFLVEGRAVVLAGEAQYQPKDDQIDVAVKFDNIVPSRLANASPQFERLAAFDFPVSGAARGSMRLSGEVGRVQFELNGRPGRLVLDKVGLLPIGVAAAKIEGRLDQELSTVLLDNVYFDLGGSNVSASAVITARKDQPEIRMNVIARNLSIADMNNLWPATVRPELREWVRGHVTSGRADDTRISVDGRLSRERGFEMDYDSLRMVSVFSGVSGSAANGMQLSGASGRAELKPGRMDLLVTDGAAKWLRGDMPPISDIKATATIVPNRHADVKIKEARFAGMTLIVDNIKVNRLDQAVPEVEGESRLEGSLGTLLAMLQKIDIGGARELDVDPALVKGTFGLRSRFRFDLGPSLSFDRVSRTATMTIKDMEVPKGPMGLVLGSPELKLVYDAHDVTVEGQLRLNGAPMAIDMKRSVDGKGDGATRIHLAGTLGDAERKALGLGTEKFVAGPIDFVVDLTRPDAATTIANAQMRLDKAKVKLAQLYWEKDRNMPGVLDLTLMMRKLQPVEVSEFQLTGGGMNAKGRALLRAGKSDLEQIEFDRLAFGGHNGSDVKAVVTRRDTGGWDVELNGPQLNLQPYVEDPDILLDFPMGVKTRVERLRLDDRRTLHNVKLEADFGGEYWNTINLVSQLGGDADLAVRYAPAGNQRDLYIYASDAGQAMQLMTASPVARDLRGGRLAIKATRSPMQPDAPMDGLVELYDFSLRGSPTGDKILASATGFGPFEILSNTDLDFHKLEASFRKAGERIDLLNLLMLSPGLGMSANGAFDLAGGTMDIKGYVSPFRGVGKLLDDTPWVGAFLVDVDKQGLIAVPFTGVGSMADPDFNVSKKSASLPPGEIRDFARMAAGKGRDGRDRDLSAVSRMPAGGQR
ncbi:MAG: hypothetical protein ACT4N4_01115 [Rhodospirillales bacterium]